MTRPDDRMRMYERLEARLLETPAVERGTMMGFPCLRVDGRYFASLDRRSGNLVIKLPADRVLELIREDAGEPFAPNGRVFREWIAVTDPKRWDALADESLRFMSR